ncbi:hypothetical protein Mmc1_1600 [Magnetococcus marinus MC-1]|uniref:Uncharacterized protein n=1 Tax=Magnetococcus marinus (strain ATCC BAA-1437 / JCM 17883 / MC-1) TaxID=156889 RepID=A0L816_MAGMM|nr:hypothetical protein [Magnetococcus marinus]ABK44109.1 hypothetical protein Mmc1_1600 [Magnetococcus marinus MC-1]
MELRWTKQAHGFQQATFPKRNFQLTANLVEERLLEGNRVEQITPLGRLIVEENPGHPLKPLFGTELAFWPEVREKLSHTTLNSQQQAELLTQISTVIPQAQGETTPRFRPRFDGEPS